MATEALRKYTPKQLSVLTIFSMSRPGTQLELTNYNKLTVLYVVLRIKRELDWKHRIH